MRIDRRLQHGYGNCATLEGRERSVFAFQHDTVNLSFMYLSTEVKLLTSLLNHGVHLTHGLGERSRWDR